MSDSFALRSRIDSVASIFRLIFTALFLCGFVPAVVAGTVADGPGKSVAAEKEVERLEAEQKRLLEQVRNELAALPAISSSSSSAQAARRARLERLLAEIERRINAESSDRRYYVSSLTPDTEIRSYYERVQHRIEEQGTISFPKIGTESVYGRVIVTFALNADGKIDRIDIAKSASKVLAEHAINLLRTLEPFESFPPEVAKRVDQMVFTSRFNYTSK